MRPDLAIIGAGGKMGPSLARLAAASGRRVLAVSRFSDAKLRAELEADRVECAVCDLLDPTSVAALPRADDVLYLAGAKFGTSRDAGRTWAINTLVPGFVAHHYAGARIVVFSSGNVYPLVDVESGGATEATPPEPVGEYAQSVLGRERVFEYIAGQTGSPLLIYRLNYAVEERYGVPVDIAQRLLAGAPIDLRMGHVNLIWQEDANAIALRCLDHAASPPRILNVTGAEVLAVRDLATQLATRLGVEPVFEGSEGHTALLSDASACHALFGAPPTSIESMLDRIADWLASGGATLDKPTMFEVRDGRF